MERPSDSRVGAYEAQEAFLADIVTRVSITS